MYNKNPDSNSTSKYLPKLGPLVFWGVCALSILASLCLSLAALWLSIH